jgi:hypothetical protein
VKPPPGTWIRANRFVALDRHRPNCTPSEKTVSGPLRPRGFDGDLDATERIGRTDDSRHEPTVVLRRIRDRRP